MSTSKDKSKDVHAIKGISRPPGMASGGQHAQKLARSLFSGQIASALREAIIGGSLGAGTPLVELQIAEQMEVSRGPVRSALNALEGEGLVRTLPNGRMVVEGFAPDDLADLFAVRLLIESTAIRWAAVGEYDPAGVVECLEAMREEGTSTPQLVDLDIHFHKTLVALSGSRFLRQSWTALEPVLHAVVTLGNRALAERDPAKNFERIIKSHEEITKPLIARDVDGVVAMLTEQFELTRSTLPVQTIGSREE